MSRAYLQIHFCVVLWGLTPILGKLISLPAAALVWWRMLLVTLALAFVPQVWRGLRQLSGALVRIYAGIGVLVALHWLAFYAAIKLANASVAASCLALCPVFLAIVEPWITGRRRDARELWLGILVIPGVLMVVGGTPTQMSAGIIAGVVSASLIAVAGSLNKRYVTQAGPLTVTAIEMVGGTLFLTVFAPLIVTQPMFQLPAERDALLLLFLAMVCTLLPFALALIALRELSAFAAQLAVNLEPVYAIVLASLLFNEQRELDTAFYVGVAIILAAVFVHPLLTRRGNRR